MSAPPPTPPNAKSPDASLDTTGLPAATTPPVATASATAPATAPATATATADNKHSSPAAAAAAATTSGGTVSPDGHKWIPAHFVEQLLGFGFSKPKVQRALYNTKGRSVDAALDWIQTTKLTDAELDAPFTVPALPPAAVAAAASAANKPKGARDGAGASGTTGASHAGTPGSGRKPKSKPAAGSDSKSGAGSKSNSDPSALAAALIASVGAAVNAAVSAPTATATPAAATSGGAATPAATTASDEALMKALMSALTNTAAVAAGAAAAAATPNAAAAGAPAGPLTARDRAAKMVLVVRMDLKMQTGKIGAQCAHAALGMYMKLNRKSAARKDVLEPWIEDGQAKVVVRCNDLPEMLAIEKAAKAAGLPTYIVQDAGRTQVASGSQTVMAVGPGEAWKFVNVTGKLKLL